MESFVYKQIFAREEKDWWFLGRQRIIMELIAQLYPNYHNLKILDIGCGGGGLLDQLKKYGQAIGIDNDRETIDFNKKKERNVFLGDANRLKFNKESFDLVTLLEVLEHLDDDLGALREASRVLKRKGRLLITVPAFSFLWGSHDLAAHHRRRYSKRELEFKLRKVGFKIKRVSYLNTFLFPVVFFVRFLNRMGGKKTKKTDFQDYPLVVNKLLELIFGFESIFVERMNLPFGVSLLAVVEKK